MAVAVVELLVMELVITAVTVVVGETQELYRGNEISDDCSFGGSRGVGAKDRRPEIRGRVSDTF